MNKYMIKVENNSSYATFSKYMLTDGRCQVVIRHDASNEWLFEDVFDNEDQADNFLNHNWKEFTKIAEDIYYAGYYAMKKTIELYKDRGVL